jgi:hypothetical protein
MTFTATDRAVISGDDASIQGGVGGDHVKWIACATIVLVLCAPLRAVAQQEEVRLPGGGELVFENFQSSPLDSVARGRIRELKGLAIAPSPLLMDTAVTTEVVSLLRQRTGVQVSTPADFVRAGGEIGVPVVASAGLTEEEQNQIARRVGQRPGAGGVLVTVPVDRGFRYFGLLFTQGYVQSFALRARLVAIEGDTVPWALTMNYRLTWRVTLGNVFSGVPAYSNQTELAMAVMRRMVDRFLTEAWAP